MGAEKKSPDRSRRGELKFFYDEQRTKTFVLSFSSAISKLQKSHTANFVLPRNVQRFQHGGAWHNPANPHAMNTGMTEHSAELITPFDDIISGDLNLIERAIKSIVDAMSAQFAAMMYSTVDKATNATGNVVNAKELGIPESFIAMLEKIEFAADKDGKVEMPTIHAHPDAANRMLAELTAQPQEYQDRVEAIKARKTQEALLREADRKKKFVRYGD